MLQVNPKRPRVNSSYTITPTKDYTASKSSWHSQLAAVAYKHHKLYYPHLTSDDVFKAYIHCCHNLLNRLKVKDYGVVYVLEKALSFIRRGKARTIRNRLGNKRRSKLYIYDADFVFAMPIDDVSKLPATILSINMVMYENKTLQQLLIESNLFNRKKWMRDLKQSL